jgi:phage baseplate assembly protein W
MAKRPLPAAISRASYRDFDLSFRCHPVTGKLIIKKEDEAVKQSVKNLVLTNKYERPFRPEFGGDVRSRLFDLYTGFTQMDYQDLISTAIKNYEPRVLLGDNSVEVKNYTDQNALGITIKFKVISSLSDLSLDINLNKVR